MRGPSRRAAIPEELTREIIAKGLSVRQAEERARREKTRPGPGADIGRASARNAAKAVDADLDALERQLGDILGLKVQVTHKGQGGAVDAALFEPRSARHDLPAPHRRADLAQRLRAFRAIASNSSPSASRSGAGVNISERSSLPARSATVARSSALHFDSIRRTLALSFQNNGSAE